MFFTKNVNFIELVSMKLQKKPLQYILKYIWIFNSLAND
jgi:hypothetical protein